MRVNDEQRFWSNVRKSDGCWEWTATTRRGYGRFSTSGQPNLAAHRYSYELANGRILNGLYVCHHCDNPLCVRPDHLFLGTAGDNARDSMRKGRFLRTRVGRLYCRLYCKAGHLMMGDNLEWKKNGTNGLARCCRICRRAATNRQAAKRKAEHAAKKKPRHHLEVVTG